MSKKILIILLVIFLFGRYGITVQAKEEQKTGNLEDEIKIYNLINGLYLDKSQMEFILSSAEELKTKKENLENEHKNSLEIQEEALLDLKEEVKENKGEVSPGVARNIHQNKLKIETLKKEQIDYLKSKVQAVKAILNENQIYSLENFKPCLVPPKGPARIGQDDSGKGFLNLFERLRQMPDFRYNQRKDEIAQRHIERLSLKFPFLEESDLNTAKHSFIKIMDKAKALSDKDFMLEKENLAKEIKEILPAPKKIDAEKVIARFLLSPQVIPVLKEKLAASGN